LRGNYINSLKCLLNLPLRRAVGALAFGTLLVSVPKAHAANITYTGEFNTLLRMGKDVNKRELYPVYEQIRLQADKTLADGSALSFQLGAWGRLDLADKSSSHDTEGDIQYALLSYQGAKIILSLIWGVSLWQRVWLPKYLTDCISGKISKPVSGLLRMLEDRL